MQGDPYYTVAKWPRVCDGKNCTHHIHTGDRIFWYPRVKLAYAVPCGCAERNERDFVSAAQDEAMMNGGYW